MRCPTLRNKEGKWWKMVWGREWRRMEGVSPRSPAFERECCRMPAKSAPAMGSLVYCLSHWKLIAQRTPMLYVPGETSYAVRM